MEAIAYSQKITSLIQELIDLYNQADKLSEGLDLEFPGIDQITIYDDEVESIWMIIAQMPKEPAMIRITNFREQMDFIKVYLKVLGTPETLVWNVLTKEELNIYKGIKGIEYESELKWLYITISINSYIQWLKDAIDECYTILEIQYQPGGKMFQQAQERNIGRYGIGL